MKILLFIHRIFILLLPVSVLFAQPATGPLKVLVSNPRYFTDGTGKAIYLTGSHTWNNFQNIIRTGNPELDYAAYLVFLKSHNHNFFRLWSWENASSMSLTDSSKLWTHDIMQYPRTGPGIALDGNLKFDLTKFDELYFTRLRDRVTEARDSGTYVAIMLFQGFSIKAKDNSHGDPWKGHPFNIQNNINHINGDLNDDGKGNEVHHLTDPNVELLQKAYIRKVIDVVNDLDNVLYEITNEDEGSPENSAWQYSMIHFIKEYEATKPNQHPVGMTVQWPNGSNLILFKSPADWISPNDQDGYGITSDPSPSIGIKVIVNDTDHSFYWIGLKKAGQTAQRAWAWKNFVSGMNLLFMDPYIDPNPWCMIGRNAPDGIRPDPYWDTIRNAMGYTRKYALKMDLASMVPSKNLATTGWCLAKPGSEYLVYQPESNKEFTVDLKPGYYYFEWFDPVSGEICDKGSFSSGGGMRDFKAPFNGDAVLYLKNNNNPSL